MNKPRRKLSQEQIDEIVTAEADDDSAWEKPISVRRSKSTMDNKNHEALLVKKQFYAVWKNADSKLSLALL